MFPSIFRTRQREDRFRQGPLETLHSGEALPWGRVSPRQHGAPQDFCSCFQGHGNSPCPPRGVRISFVNFFGQWNEGHFQAEASDAEVKPPRTFLSRLSDIGGAHCPGGAALSHHLKRHSFWRVPNPAGTPTRERSTILLDVVLGGAVCYCATIRPVLTNTGADGRPGQHPETPGCLPPDVQGAGLLHTTQEPQQRKKE